MQDVFDCNPELTVSEVREWAERETNPHLAEYLRECIENQTND